MINQEMVDFVTTQTEGGVPPEKIKSDLMANGWNEADIQEAFIAMPRKAMAVKKNPIQSQEEKRSKPVYIILIISIFLILLAGGIFLYIYLNKTNSSLLEFNTPKENPSFPVTKTIEPPISDPVIIPKSEPKIETTTTIISTSSIDISSTTANTSSSTTSEISTTTSTSTIQ